MAEIEESKKAKRRPPLNFSFAKTKDEFDYLVLSRGGQVEEKGSVEGTREIRATRLPFGGYVAIRAPKTQNGVAELERLLSKTHPAVVVTLRDHATEHGKKSYYRYWLSREEEEKEGGHSKRSVKYDTQKIFSEEGYALVSTDGADLSHFEVRKVITDEDRLYFHVYYNAWPDGKVPRDGFSVLERISILVEYCKKKSVAFSLKKQKHNEDAQVASKHPKTIVHCAAGVGRTGTYIAYRLNRDGIHDSPLISIRELRSYRTNMLGRLCQFRYLQEALNRRQDIVSQIKDGVTDEPSEEPKRLHRFFVMVTSSEPSHTHTTHHTHHTHTHTTHNKNATHHSSKQKSEKDREVVMWFHIATFKLGADDTLKSVEAAEVKLIQSFYNTNEHPETLKYFKIYRGVPDSR